MTDLVDYIKRKIPSQCCVEKCRRQKCRVNLDQAPSPFVLINMDCDRLDIDEGSSRCDFLFVSQGEEGMPGWVVALELKGRPRASTVVAQLQAGARFAERILRNDAEIRFRPVAFYSGGLHSNDTTRLRNASIKFRHPKTGKVLTERVILRNCGSLLKDALRV